MTDKEWRGEFIRLADAYYHATGEVWPSPCGVPITVTEDTLAEMYETQGMKLTEIAGLFGCSPATVSAHLQRHGVKVRSCADYQRTEAQAAYFQRLRNDGERRRAEKPEKPKKESAHMFTASNGYVMRKAPDHPRANVHGYVPEHTLVMEKLIGRYLAEDEVVHHINRKRGDNSPENLQLMTKSEHHALHGRENIWYARAALAKKKGASA